MKTQINLLIFCIQFYIIESKYLKAMHFALHNPVSGRYLWITFVSIELFHHNKNILLICYYTGVRVQVIPKSSALALFTRAFMRVQ